MRYGVLAEPADLATHPPTRAQVRTVLVVIAALVLPLALLAPLAGSALPTAPEFVPMVQSALIGANLLTGILLLGHVHTNRSWPLGILTLGYLFTALIALAHMLTFPGLFARHGVLGGNGQSTPWLFLAWHALFPLFVLGYSRRYGRALPGHFMRAGTLLTILFVSLLVLLCTSGAPWLPVLVAGQRYQPAYRLLGAAVLALSLLALWRVVRKRPRALLDLWLMVALAAWAAEVLLACLLGGVHDDLGFYAGRLYGLVAALLVLGAVAIDNIALHARLRGTIEEMTETHARAQWQSLLGSVLRQLPDGVLIVDREGRCVMANDQAERMAARFEHAGRAGTPGPAAMLALIGEPVRRAIDGCAFRDAMLESVEEDGRRVYAVSGAPLR